MALASVGPELHVEEVLRAYVNGQLPGGYLKDKVIIAGRPVGALDPPQEDLEVFIAEMTVMAKRQRHPLVESFVQALGRATPNFALEQTAGLHSAAAAAHRERSPEAKARRR